MVNGTNGSRHVLGIFDINMEDTNWIMTSSFIIFTMQTGFGMLESGCVSVKNEVNIMMKNVIDVALGGLTYWAFGFGLSFGEIHTPFIAFGHFFVDTEMDDTLMGPIFGAFLFQLSFATTATTIVSGAMAERCNFKAYCLFSLLNTVVYCLPAGWVWGEHGFLQKLGVVDIAGSGPVHLIGGASALASAIMLGPRLGRYDKGTDALPLGSPVNAVLGLFVLWWGWMAFNSGSTYGVSGLKWEYSARAAVLTMLSSFGGALTGLVYSMNRHNGRLDIIDMINGVLGSLVSITAGCFLYQAHEAVLIGVIGGAVACLSMPIFDKFGIDDPVGATSVHGMCGMWGVIAVGLFAQDPIHLQTTSGRNGLFHGGGFYLLGVQVLMVVVLAVWAFCITACILWFVDRLIPIRMEPHEELLGADLVEHMIRHNGIGLSRAVSALRPFPDDDLIDSFQVCGENPGHTSFLDMYEKNKREKGTTDIMDSIRGSATFLKPPFSRLSSHSRRLSSHSPHHSVHSARHLAHSARHSVHSGRHASRSSRRTSRSVYPAEEDIRTRPSSRMNSIASVESALNEGYGSTQYAWVE